MPLEVQEISIGMHVSKGTPKASSGCGEGDSSSSSEVEQNAIVQECVRRVLEILKMTRDR